MKALFIFTFMLLTVIAVASAEPSAIDLVFKDANNNQLITSAPLLITAIDSNNNVVRIARFIDQTGTASVPLGQGNWTLKIRVDKPNTLGFDYFAEQTLTIDDQKSETIFLVPGGTLHGTVVDKLDNVVGNAELKFDCPPGISEYPMYTDNFGTFSVEWIPTGTCTISAKYKNGVGSQTVTLTQGENANIEIRLDKNVVAPADRTWVVIVSFVALAAIAGFWFFRKSKAPANETVAKPKTAAKKKAEQPKHDERKEDHTKRSRDIIETLGGKEKQVVEFLLQNPETSQAKIYYRTGIPKTSLARILQNLVHRKVIEIERIGKLKKVKLTHWFMGKE